MKAEIKSDGCIWITAESPAETYAMRYLNSGSAPCERCGIIAPPIVFDGSMDFQEADIE